MRLAAAETRLRKKPQAAALLRLRQQAQVPAQPTLMKAQLPMQAKLQPLRRRPRKGPRTRRNPKAL